MEEFKSPVCGYHSPNQHSVNGFSAVPEVEATETPEEGPLTIVGRARGVWLSRRSVDAIVPGFGAQPGVSLSQLGFLLTLTKKAN